MTARDALPPLVCVVGRSNAGKTTFMEKLLPELARLALSVGTIKHDVHGFDIDVPGKDSWRHKRAGARRTVISSPAKLALVQDTDHDWSLDELLGFFRGMDLVLVEGYKRAERPKIEVYRPEVHAEPFCSSDENLIALVSDAPLDLNVPRFGLNDAAGLAAFLKRHFQL